MALKREAPTVTAAAPATAPPNPEAVVREKVDAVTDTACRAQTPPPSPAVAEVALKVEEETLTPPWVEMRAPPLPAEVFVKVHPDALAKLTPEMAPPCINTHRRDGWAKTTVRRRARGDESCVLVGEGW